MPFPPVLPSVPNGVAFCCAQCSGAATWDALPILQNEAKSGGIAAATPAIVIDMAQGHDFRIENGPRRSTFQAKGHLSVSLGTTSAREARILAARLGTLFELEWAKYEQSISQMDERPQQDLIESLAETLAANARQLIGHYRATEVARLSPQVREKSLCPC